jgi:hypothetical protein
MDDDRVIAEYRALLIETEQKSQADFDKAVLTLSGGALGLSFAFVRNLVGAGEFIHPLYLLIAWISWGLSQTAILLSFYFSTLALRKAVRQLDHRKLPTEKPGGWWDRATASLNFLGLVLFVIGLAMIIIFLSYNWNLK